MILASLVMIGATLGGAGDPAEELAEGERSRCYDVLIHGLEDESPFVRVHAAEALVSLHRPEPALAAFRPKSDTKEPVYRIVVWRVLAAAESEAEKRREYVGRIRAALLDPNGSDQTHAMEALAKLGEPAAADAERQCIHEVADSAGPASPFALWRLVQAGEKDAVDRLAKLLQSKDPVTLIRAIYVLGRLRPECPTAGAALSAALVTEPADSSARSMLRAAVGGDALREQLGDTKLPPSDRYFAATFLAESGTPRDYPRLADLLCESHRDLRVSGAYALLKIDSRSTAKVSTSGPEAIK